MHDISLIGQLLRDFLQHMNSQQNCDDYVLIGINNTEQYIAEYEVQQLLSHAPSVGYEFIGADNTFIREILGYGYKHKATLDLDLHEDFFHAHTTLVFWRY